MMHSRGDICKYMGDIDMAMLILDGTGVCECLSPVGKKTTGRNAQCLACRKPLDVLASEYQGISYLTEEDNEYRSMWYD